MIANNRSQIDHKSTKNHPNIDQNSIKREAWRGSGRILAPKRVLGGVQGDFKSVQNDFYQILAPTWAQLGTQDGTKLDLKSFKNRCRNR